MHKMILWTMVTAYLSLLAHAFVPHHHHGDGTAFLNHKSCPHEHDPASHHTEGIDAIGDCETLKHTRLEQTDQDDDSRKPFATAVWGEMPPAGYAIEAVLTKTTDTTVPWLSERLTRSAVGSGGLRGPPVYWFS